MIVLKTRKDLERAVGDTEFGYIAMDKKQSYDEFHAGHEYLINYSKNNFEVTVVTFWDTVELMYEIYKVPQYQQELNKKWDPTSCYRWCSDHGVDFVLSPDDGYSSEYLKELDFDPTTDIRGVMNWVQDVWEKEGYAEYEPGKEDDSPFNNTIKAKTFIILQKLKTPLNCNFISTWKDGEARLIVADYINKYTKENYILLDPLKDTDSVYYSTTKSQLPTEALEILKKIESSVQSGYTDLEELKNRINSLDTKRVGFYVRRIDYIEGGVVGRENDYVNVQYVVGNIEDSYPIYLKGVRAIEEQPTRESK